MEFNKVINGMIRFIDKEIMPQMNDWQEFVARMAVGRFVKNSETLKESLVENAFVRTFAIIDGQGMVDVDGLAADLKELIRNKGKLEFSIPMLGNFKFVESDVDKLYQYIMGAI
jgi:hypothetical protein